jgi:pimeloyl-ACP methyl ester carboxylesterase
MQQLFHLFKKHPFLSESNTMTNATGRTGDATIRLSDGRRLQAFEVGKSDGPSIFHCHGNGSSRLEVLTVAAAAEQLGVRLISLDRPGIGRSDPKPGYRLLDWPDDVVEVADQLGIEQFAVEGFSSSLSERTESGQASRHATERVPHDTGRDN